MYDTSSSSTSAALPSSSISSIKILLLVSYILSTSLLEYRVSDDFLTVSFFAPGAMKSRSSTSKIKVAFGGILGGMPWSPYAYWYGQTNLAFYPFFI